MGKQGVWAYGSNLRATTTRPTNGPKRPALRPWWDQVDCVWFTGNRRYCEKGKNCGTGRVSTEHGGGSGTYV